MQTILILVAIEVAAAQHKNLPIVPPQETTDYDSGKVCEDDLHPLGSSPYLERRYPLEPLLVVRASVFGPVDRYEDRTA